MFPYISNITCNYNNVLQEMITYYLLPCFCQQLSDCLWCLEGTYILEFYWIYLCKHLNLSTMHGIIVFGHIKYITTCWRSEYWKWVISKVSLLFFLFLVLVEYIQLIVIEITIRVTKARPPCICEVKETPSI